MIKGCTGDIQLHHLFFVLHAGTHLEVYVGGNEAVEVCF